MKVVCFVESLVCFFSPLKMIELSVSQSGQMRLGMRVFIKNFQTLKACPCRKIFLNSSNSLAEDRVVSRLPDS